MAAGLTELLALQDLDLATDQLRHRRTHLPERTQLDEVEARLAGLQRERSALAATLDGLGRRQAEAEAELAASEARADAVGKRLFGGEVTASRELQAMAADLDHLKARTSTLEDQVLAILDEREPLDARAAELDQSIAEAEAERTAATAALADAEAVVDADLAAQIARRAEVAAPVPDALLAGYERLRARLGGVGVARLVGNHCDGCHLTLSAVELDRVRHLADGELYHCEQCSRILVP